jgi:hypothetical protein
MLERSRYFRDFFQRAKDQGSDEPFETFIFHWLAMIIGFTELLSNNTYIVPKYKGDRDLIDHFLDDCEYIAESKLAHVILEDGLINSRIFLANRKGKARGHDILDGSGRKRGLYWLNVGAVRLKWKRSTNFRPFYTLLAMFGTTFFMVQNHLWNRPM